MGLFTAFGISFLFHRQVPCIYCEQIQVLDDNTRYLAISSLVWAGILLCFYSWGRKVHFTDKFAARFVYDGWVFGLDVWEISAKIFLIYDRLGFESSRRWILSV